MDKPIHLSIWKIVLCAKVCYVIGPLHPQPSLLPDYTKQFCTVILHRRETRTAECFHQQTRKKKARLYFMRGK